MVLQMYHSACISSKIIDFGAFLPEKKQADKN